MTQPDSITTTGAVEAYDVIQPLSGDMREWLILQLEQWPRRVNEQFTTSLTYLMAAAAATLRATPTPASEAGETWESINQWCDDTFGPATTPQIIERAKEEFTELEAPDADHAIEAADVVICLCRTPGFAEALQRKMAINRERKWRLTGNGTGYHIPTKERQDD